MNTTEQVEHIRMLIEIKELKQGMREIYEVWAGSEGTVSSTASEAYQERLIEEMRDIAGIYLSNEPGY